MKPSPERLQRDHYPRHKPVPIRFADVDMFRHLNNVATGQFYEEARFELLAEARERAGKDERGAMVLANVDTAFLRQARYPGTIEVATGIVSLGERSLVIGQALFLEGKCIGTADSVVVCIGSDGPCPIARPIAEYFKGLILPVS
ncbi:MAG: acyl-CoA thioesterase [Blastomonas sp.]